MSEQASPEQTSAVCARCAAEDEELVPVWADADEPELWCADCRERHPHEPAEDGEDGEDG